AGLNHEGSGQLTNDLYKLSTDTKLASFDLTYDGIHYLNKTQLDWLADLELDLANNIYKLVENSLQINALKLDLDAEVGLPDAETVDLDIAFKAPGTDFRELFSLIPNAFIEGYEAVKIDGQFALTGSVQGAYRGESYPAIDVKASIENGAVQYPDLPLGIAGVGANIDVQKPEGDLDKLIINIPRFMANVGAQPVNGRFYLASPMSDPNMDMALQAKLDLAKVTQAFPVEGVQQLAGLIDTDIALKTRLSAIEQERYEDVNVQGQLQIDQLVYQGLGLPMVNIKSARADFSPQRVQIDEFNSQLGRSDLSLTGSIDNLLAYFSPDKMLTGQLVAQSSYFDVDEWMYSDTPAEETNAEGSTEPGPSARPFDRFLFVFDAEIDQLKYTPYELSNMRAKGRISADEVRLDEFFTELGDSDFGMRGNLDQLFAYLYEGQTLKGEVDFISSNLNLNAIMVSEEAPEASASAEETTMEPIPVPANLDLVMNAAIARVQYGEIELRNMRGEIDIVNEEVDLRECVAEGMDGTLAFSGSYNTSDPENPRFDFLYDLRSINFGQAFKGFNTLQYLAPIGQYIDGNFNTNMAMSGVLGQDMMPNMNTLSADGFLETLNGVIKGYPPLVNLSQKLNLDLFERFNIGDTRNWFTVRDGKVILKDTKMTKQDIDLVIGGAHGFDQSMEYKILAKVPREKLDNNAIGDLANSGIGALQQEAGKLGIQWEQSEFINLGIALLGSIKDPSVKVNVLGGEGDVSLAEAAKQEAKDQLNAEKEKLEAEAQQRIDEEKAKLEAELKKKEEEAKAKIEEEVNKKTEEVKKEAKDKLEETIGKESQETIDDIKNKLENYNPFKKKKKGGN
ncbi:MAG: AsmA-like C-terminal region-containing protein, partial [Bacteroidota bacterium]